MMKSCVGFFELKFYTSLFFVFLLVASHKSAAETTAPDSGSRISVPAGWAFVPTTSDSLVRAHPDQIGSLQETKKPSRFLTATVILRRASALSTRTASAKMVRLEKELAAYLDARKEKPNHKSAKIIGEVPALEVEIGRPGKGLFWVFATVKRDSVLLVAVDSRDAKPDPKVRAEFFEMARSIEPKDSY